MQLPEPTPVRERETSASTCTRSRLPASEHWCSAGSVLLLTSSACLATVPSAASPPVPPDRYTFYGVPLLFVAFAAWIGSGAIREAGTAWVAAGVAALPIIGALVAVT